MLQVKETFWNTRFLKVFVLIEFLTCKSLKYVIVDSSYHLIVMLCVGFQIEDHMAYHLSCTEEFLSAWH